MLYPVYFEESVDYYLSQTNKYLPSFFIYIKLVKTIIDLFNFKGWVARIVSHLIFWAVAYLFFIVFYGRANQNYQMTVIFVSLLFPLAMATTYLLIYYLIPRFLFRGKRFLFALLLIYLIVITSWLSELISVIIFISFANYQVKAMVPVSFDVLSLIVGLYFICLIAVAIKQIKRAFFMQQENAELEKRKLDIELKLKDAELKLLKAQIHPHFLFNTLNNLYGLALEKSDMAPDLVLRLSGLLDYMLYQCNQSKVSLLDEINQLYNYIEIEQLRYGERLQLEINQSGDAGNLQIAPMLLLPFIENAFKHGVSKQISHPFILVNIIIQASQLVLNIENSFDRSFEKEQEYSKGIGLNNVKKRLEMLYPENYSLLISSEETTFKVILKIFL